MNRAILFFDKRSVRAFAEDVKGILGAFSLGLLWVVAPGFTALELAGAVKVELQPELHHAVASGTDQRIASRYTGCRAPAAQAVAARVIADTPTTPANRRAVRIG